MGGSPESNRRVKHTRTEPKREAKKRNHGGKPVPIEPLPHCTTAPHAETARSANDDEPCDDGRGQGAES